MAYEVEVRIPDVPEDAEEVLSALGDALGAIVAGLDGDDWTLEPGAQDGLVGAWATRWAEGRSHGVSLTGAWDEGPPEVWTLQASVGMMPVVTRADKIYGWLSVAFCLGAGIAVGGGVFWCLSDSPVWAGSVATPVGVMTSVVALFVAVFVTPKSPKPPLQEGVEEAYEGAVAASVEALVAEGRFALLG